TGELIDAGIDAISSGYANDAAGQKTQITALVGNLGESATAALSQLTAATTEDFSNVLKSSAETFSKAVSSSTENNLSAEVLSQLGQDLSSEVPTLFDDTTAYLTASTTVDRADAKEITNGISSLSNAILDTGTPLNAEVVTKNQAFADTSITRSISAIAEGHALSIDAADIQQQDRVQEFLRDNPLVLQDVLAESIPRLTASIGIGQAARSTNIATSLGVDEATASGLADSLPAAVDSQQAITTTTNSDGSTTTVSAFSALSSAALDSFTGSSSNELTVDPASGAVKISATASGTSLEGSTSSVFISDTYISSDLLPDGLHTLPDGSRVSVSAGVSNRLSPAPGDATSLLYTLENTLGLPSAISSDGQVAVDLGGVGTFTAGFDYQVNPDLSRAIASSSFSVIGTDPSST
ncbi:MAG: hypothetical protein HN344_10210, partial [Gammaproteobacteria bacterium]|nr:hypothetical protein [Gammaproteobacteria bacterium]